MRGEKIDRVTVLRDLQEIEEADYDGFVPLVRAARNRNATFDRDLSVWAQLNVWESSWTVTMVAL
jgi:hypothetical protein